MALKSERRRRQSLFPRIFRVKEKKESTEIANPFDPSDEFVEVSGFATPATPFYMEKISDKGNESGTRLGRMNLNSVSSMEPNISETQTYRIFVATWNVGGKSPHSGLNPNDFLPAEDQSDIYVLGFQEIVPLNAGNVLVIEDNEPAVKWLGLINQALNKPLENEDFTVPQTPSTYTDTSTQALGTKSLVSQDVKTNTNSFFQKPSLKSVSRALRAEHGRRLKTCNCPSEVSRKGYRDSCFRCPHSYIRENYSSEEEEEEPGFPEMTDLPPNQQKYCLVASKQMVGIFVTIWVKREHVQHIGHLRLSTVGCGILGYLGNKGCISVSMSLHQTSFCFVCSHLASGEKEGDELRRNSDVIEILKSSQFPRICKVPNRRIPERILEHDRVIWLGDLNYRIALSYTKTRQLLDDNDWDTLLEKDQLKIEREAGRVFKGWNEGKIYFAPTYKYSDNSDAYFGEIVRSKKKRRTPAWCDRILWHGDGIEQRSYIRGESKFSDHRPVCAVFVVEVGVPNGRLKNGPNMKVGAEELLPPGSTFF